MGGYTRGGVGYTRGRGGYTSGVSMTWYSDHMVLTSSDGH